jgi:hypothetical protein
MNMQELETGLDQMVHALKLKTKKAVLGRDSAVQHVCDDFGVVITGIQRVDYSDIDSVMQARFENWRLIYVTTDDDFNTKRLEVIWELMRVGYMKWIRQNYSRDFTNLLTQQNFGNEIIKERLRIWADRPMYKFMIEDNKNAMRYPANMILALEPSFFDYMP